MAASLGMHSVLIEPYALCHTLGRIPALGNVLGGFGTGPDLAAAITADVAGTGGLCRVRLGERVTGVHAFDDRVEVTLDGGGRRLSAPRVLVATGVGPVPVGSASWISAPATLPLPPLWEAGPAAVTGRTLLVLGADRPLGTLLRAHPEAGLSLVVAYPPADGYKTEEIRADSRVTLVPTARLVLRALGPSHIAAETTGHDGERRVWEADGAHLNLGSTPAPPPGDLIPAADGYCPPSAQHPRVLTAGDLRGARFQRVMTAMGSGGEAALRAYYEVSADRGKAGS
jgi:thioredoxin reductase (NADPH)/alkyl hydroperoxide reductase subunit F